MDFEIIIQQGSHLTPNQQSQNPVFGLGLLTTFQENLTKLHSGTPTLIKKCPLDSCFENPSENPDTGMFLR